MNDQLYLYQSRRLAKILKGLFNIKCNHTNYTSWEYYINPNLEFYITYTNGWNDKRFYCIDRVSRKSIIQTDSLREIVEYLKEQA